MIEICSIAKSGECSGQGRRITSYNVCYTKLLRVQQLDDKLPGLYFIETDALGERTFHYWRNDAAARYWLRGPDAERVGCALCGFDYLYLSGITSYNFV